MGRASICWIGLAALGLWSGCGSGEVRTTDERPALDVAVEFHALWWSPEQMDNLDPDAPPPKETDVVLESWEYTDPIGVPNPDEFDVVVILTNLRNERITDLQIAAVPRWGIGPLYGDSADTWRTLPPVRAPGPIALEPGASGTFRLTTVDLATQQARLWDQDRWPWAFEVTVTVSHEGSSEPPLAERVARLPIYPGD